MTDIKTTSTKSGSGKDAFRTLLFATVAAGAFAANPSLNLHSIGGVLAVLLFWGNLVVVGFNLLPGLPLDGGRLLRAGIWAIAKSRLTGTRVGAWAGRIIAVLLVLGAILSQGATGDATTVFVAGFMSLYLWAGATQALRTAELEAKLPALDMATLLRPGLLVPSDLSVAEALQRVWSGSARGLVTVDAADHPTAIVNEARIGEVPPERRPWTPVASVARSLEPGLVLPISLTGEELIEAVRKTPATEYLVVHPDGAPAGILSTVDLATTLKRQP